MGDIMPIGKYKDFPSCVKAVMKSKGLDKEKASAYCATIERKIEEAKANHKWEMVDTN